MLTFTIRGLDGKVLSEYEQPLFFVSALWVQDYVYRDGELVASERVTEEGGTRHYHLDHLGTPRLITNASAQRMAADDYLPFGREVTSWRQEMTTFETDRPERLHFTGHERDFVGNVDEEHENYLDYMHARYYSPGGGRFLEVDPDRDLQKTTQSPQTWNRYAYVMNDPLRNIDPTGRSHVEYNGDSHLLMFYAQDGTLLGTWDASNHPQNSASADPLKKGSYSVVKADQSAPAKHSGSHELKTLDATAGKMVVVKDANGKNVKVPDDSRQGKYGTYGIIHIDVAGHDGIGVHSGRDGVTDGYGNTGWAYATDGCIRTTDDAMKVISTTMKTDPLTRVDVVHEDVRHWNTP